MIATITAKKKVAQEQIDHLKRLKDSHKELSSKYGPLFSKYMEKALQNAKDIKHEDMSSRISDPKTLGDYQQIIENVKSYATLVNDSHNMLVSVYQAHEEINRIYKRILIAEENLRSYIRNDNIVLNDDSISTFEKLKELEGNMKTLVIKLKRHIEIGFDKLNSVEI